MFFMRILTAASTAALLTLVGHGAQAQSDLTADEIKDAFNKQKTRGLVIVPSGQAATETAQTQPQTEVVAAEEYTAVDKADQVNVKISFDFDSAALREDQKPRLNSLCEAMKAVDVAVFQIIGHTDSSGSAAYNENLSLLRAQEVKRHMVSSCGIEENRLKAIGLGESAPFDPSDPRSDANRRVEFQALG
ncbi:OmpA/MotB domain protein [Sulfitobacter noctilucicola]|uniref:Outer membrane protein OmpA-like peptidoglycan-associated protein n=1 Tax=Sulfitobacter noctilucicola TaxID=1342301 RepID=A0A7W6MCM0_9RHOB|nr:OmpA family protein [Sulfitobacter noctilucicola]KIN69981.1 OmpA/MotB domain protein [Sulfitobacter noctilucicola]MBB4176088.1 outer membrane protein OmpA-like peptidoglycan-associated protein [Sulfitobacter noctilucicola]